MWSEIPSPQDYLCSQKEYIDALNKAIEQKVQLNSILKPNPKRIKNQALIGSLNNDSSNIEKSSSAKETSINRQDTKATENLQKIKHGGIVSERLGENKVVHETNELRTVQSNKRIQKTRKAVIVRHKSEHVTKTFLAKMFNVLSFVLVIVVGAVFGVFAGNMYVASKTLVDYGNLNETDYLPNYQLVYNANSLKAPNQVAAADAYVMAEGVLLSYSGIDSANLVNNYTITGRGTVSAKVGGISQQQVVSKKVSKNGNEFISESVTDGLIPAAELYKYNLADNTINSYFTQSVDGKPPQASYGKDPYKTYDLNTQLEDFRKEYGVKPESIFAPIVSEKTVDKGTYIEAVEGGHKYQITLNNMSSVINYVQLMIHISGLKRPPTFYQITITFTVDENYRFKEVYFYEEYQIYYMGMPADCVAETTYTFEY